METPFSYITCVYTVELEGEIRDIELTWIKVNPACRVVPETPLDFYIIKTKNGKGDWVLL